MEDEVTAEVMVHGTILEMFRIKLLDLQILIYSWYIVAFFWFACVGTSIAIGTDPNGDRSCEMFHKHTNSRNSKTETAIHKRD